MKRVFLFVFVFTLLVSCYKRKGCDYGTVSFTAPTEEQENVQAYLSTHGITADKLPQGLFYKITNEGSGATPTVCSHVVVKYTGTLTDGTIFDQTAGAETRTFQLGGLIFGWQLGLPLIKKGGSISLYIPPSFGYGSEAAGNVPANSILLFDIELVDVY